MEFGGWLFQDAGDLTCAMHWTDRALDYALELGDQRIVAYTLMRKGLIATEAGNPAQGLGIANSALQQRNALTPRLRAVILRQRSYSNAALGEVLASARDSDEALIEAVAGEQQGEDDRAPYCTPAYVSMEAGASWVLLPRGVAGPLSGPRLCAVRGPPGHGLHRRWATGTGMRHDAGGSDSRSGTGLTPRG
jgi:hypothetical protein